MESRIPVPTDNIFKFYALFGLLLIIFGCGSALYVMSNANELAFETLPEIESLKSLEQRSPEEVAKLSILERKLEISRTDRVFFTNSIGGILAIGIILTVAGFVAWHFRIQPILDRTAKAQAELVELQVRKLRAELEPPTKPGQPDVPPALNPESDNVMPKE